MKAGYRHDIEGLRGVAVLSVFAVHSIPDSARGGFVGVDVFFVISGYLISLLTLQAIDAGRFSVRDFYRRRILRIVPALLVVLLACLFFATFVAFPKETREIGKHVAGGAAFVSNLVLWREAGYFDQSSEFKPLLHLWSLGIEEQFYLFWPLAALVLHRLGRRGWWALGVALLASFLLNLWFVEAKPKGTFFLPPTRFWEILIGALLAHAVHWVPGGPTGALGRVLGLAPSAQRRLEDAISLTGVALLVLAITMIDKTDLFPGAWALLPTLGAACIIAAGPQALPNRRVLSLPLLQFYGRISFSLYLWHWPLLTFPLLIGWQQTIWEKTLVLCASVLLAVATHRWVEVPARRGSRVPFTPRWLAAALVLTAATGLALFRSDGLLVRYPGEVREIAAMHGNDDYPAYRADHCFMPRAKPVEAFPSECRFPTGGAGPLIALWGDSHAAALYPGLRHWADMSRPHAGVAQLTAALCPPLPGPEARLSPGCAAYNEGMLAALVAMRPTIVVLGGYWSRYREDSDADDGVLDGLGHTIRRLRAAGVDRVVVVGPVPEWSAALPALLLVDWRAEGAPSVRRSRGLVGHAFDVDQRLERIVRDAGGSYFSPLRALCDVEGCLALTWDARALVPTAFDETHLTVAGSRRLVPLLMRELGF